jgi:isoleucyl-tRNA synthetase
VALDLELTDDLRLEGTARELVRALNDLRKEIGLEIADRVSVRVAAPPEVRAAIDAHGAWIAGEVLATELVTSDSEPDGHTITFDDHTLQVTITKQ